jgi:hypothetical protein
MAKYHLRNFFDLGASICLWSSNDAARQKFGYPVDASDSALPENTQRRLVYLAARYDRSLDWNYPPDPSPWDEAERQRFNAEAQKWLATLREQLGPDFEIEDQSGTVKQADIRARTSVRTGNMQHRMASMV